MTIYEHTIRQIKDNRKKNLTEKLSGSNGSEFKQICSLLESKYNIQPNNLLGLGTSCIVYSYGQMVIKICAKRIKYFHYHKKRSAELLKKTSETLTPNFLPIKEILYDGDEFFVYTQDKCKPLSKKKPIKNHELRDLLSLIKTMFKNGFIVGQIKPKNVGYFNDHVVLFDYHSMHPLYERMKKTKWNHSIIEALECYNDLYQHGHCNDLHTLIGLIKKTDNESGIHQVINQINHICSNL